MTIDDVLWFSVVAGTVGLLLHRFVCNYWLALVLGAFGTSVANVGYELVKHDFVLRPSDAAFWIPMMLFMGVALALPVVALVGIPFYVIRRRK